MADFDLNVDSLIQRLLEKPVYDRIGISAKNYLSLLNISS
uniref:Uncharacterized protein n=1 Tax=Glossina morsitans morsitans TaxID=37546 RepID=A0A1B0G9U4_GLOMM